MVWQWWNEEEGLAEGTSELWGSVPPARKNTPPSRVPSICEAVAGRVRRHRLGGR